MTIFSFIFARGGSKGLPNKNILRINNIPLLAYSIKASQRLSCIDKVFVSTDSSAIAEVASTYGAEIIERPAELATDTSPEWLSWKHAIHELYTRGFSFDTFLSLPATAPLRADIDVINLIEKYNQAKSDIVLAMSESSRNPWFNMVSINKKDDSLFIVNNANDIHRRQEAPKCYDVSTVGYCTSPDYVLSASSLWSGKVSGITIPKYRALDIDDYTDYQIAKLIIEQRIPLT